MQCSTDIGEVEQASSRKNGQPTCGKGPFSEAEKGEETVQQDPALAHGIRATPAVPVPSQPSRKSGEPHQGLDEYAHS